MKVKQNRIIILMVLSMLSAVTVAFAASQAEYNAMPPFLTTTKILPNVMFMMDNSGSMKNTLAESEFDATKTYYGMFDGTKNYKYDTTIPVGTGGYDGLPYDVAVDATVTGAFIEDSSCTIGSGNNCWNGSFLNWVVTRRIDAARIVMVGGKVEDRAGYDYVSGDGGDLEWKIVGNNERSDRAMNRTSPVSSNYNQFPNSSLFSVTSPATGGGTNASYDPYAKLKVTPRTLTDKNGTTIGEYGTVNGFGADAGQANWYTVSLSHTYTDPVVVAVPLSYNGSDPAVARIKSVAATSFKVRTEEWEYISNLKHTAEDISYLVIEKGTHELTGGQLITAGTEDIDTSDENVDISAVGFAAAPVVLSSVTTNNDATTVTTRQKNITQNGFTIALQEQESGGNHNDETISYIALTSGDYDDGFVDFQVGIESGVDEGWSTISFTDTGVEPSFLSCMQTTDDSDPAALRYKDLDTTSVEIFVEEEKSDDTEINHGNEEVGYVILSPITPPTTYNVVLIVEEEPTGLLHDISNKVRLGITMYNYEQDSDIYNGEEYHGGTMKLSIPKNPFVKDAANTTFRTVETPIKAGIDDIVDAIEHYPLVWGTTPLTENYYEVVRYFQQVAPYYPTINDASAGTYDHYNVSNAWDPYYYNDPNGDGNTSDAGLVDCVKSYVLVFTDGEPWKDDGLPCYSSGSDAYTGTLPADTSGCTDYDGNNTGSEGSSSNFSSNKYNNHLDDLALWAHSVVNQTTYVTTGDRDLRSDAGLDSDQNLITYTVGFGSDTLKPILVDTAAHGGGLAYAAEDGRELNSQLTNAFTDIISRSSGTAASVISNTRSGEGAIYQSVFFPSLEDASNELSWVGQTHALLVDAYGNMREDTDGDDTLDLTDDYLIIFNEDGTAKRYKDGDGNQRLELDISTCPDDIIGTCNDSYIDEVGLDDLKYLWNTSEWLNEISDTDVESQRTSYMPSTFEDKRYIFTWVDANADNIVDSGEEIPFISSVTPSAADLIDPAKIYPYLHLYPSFSDRPVAINSLSAANLEYFLRIQTKRQINYIRGSDCVTSGNPEDCNTLPLQVASIDVDDTEMRSRQYDYDGDSTVETWRLGDIVYSTPTLAGRPAENLHLLYRDASYAPFADKYHNRRQIIFAGANDGMVHAFNAGFYDAQNKRFCSSSDFTNCQDATQPELGAELWAYVPFNLLPHLYWLTQSSYDEERHVYYVDQKPRIFDAKIFTEEAQCPADIEDPSCIHPGGWGTVMVIGMNLGGGSIIADMDKTDGVNPDMDPVGTDGDGVDPTMKSAFMIFDITNPEAAPKLLAEITMPKMGFATSYPTVLTLKDGDGDSIYEDSANGENKWYLAFGSGPADANGDPGTVSVANGDYDNEILDDVKSLQPGQFYLLDLVKLASNNELYTLDVNGALTSGLNPYAVLDSNTFISAPVSVDYDLDYNADALYFGTVSGTVKPWAGKLRRIVVDNNNDSTTWNSDSTLMDVGQPIVAAPAIGLDGNGKNWVFFGTGRYFNTDDKSDTNQQSFYGLKEPLDISGNKDWSTLTTADLMDVTNINVYTDEYVEGGVTNNDWTGLVSDQSAEDGWYLNFSSGTGERNLGQAALIGGLLSFTTFVPESNICTAGGESYLWALYYETGTAHYSGILDTTTVTVGAGNKEQAISKISLGQGLATSPSIHVGSEEGSTVFVQSSSGEITRIEQENALETKSGIQSWKLGD